jgi:glucose/arabinose dehydrogenase
MQHIPLARSVFTVTAFALACGLGKQELEAATARVLKTQTGPIRATRVAGGLAHPWGIAFLPDGRMLVTERTGRLRIIDGSGKVSAPLRGVPKVVVSGQAGLLDVALSWSSQ